MLDPIGTTPAPDLNSRSIVWSQELTRTWNEPTEIKVWDGVDWRCIQLSLPPKTCIKFYRVKLAAPTSTPLEGTRTYPLPPGDYFGWTLEFEVTREGRPRMGRGHLKIFSAESEAQETLVYILIGMTRSANDPSVLVHPSAVKE